MIFFIEMFLHTENQLLLWQTLQKSPYLIEFSQKFAGYREEWFRGVVEQFYTQWISRHNRVPSNAQELLEINKYALQTMVADLKRLLGYPLSSQYSSKPQSSSYQVAATNELPSYNVAEERQRREEQWSTNFSKYQAEYNQLLETPALPMRGLPSEICDDKIKNMDELLKEQERMRDMDFSIYTPSSSSMSTPSSSFTQQKYLTTEKQVPKLKILDEIERIEINQEIELSNKKTVRFSQEEELVAYENAKFE